MSFRQLIRTALCRMDGESKTSSKVTVIIHLCDQGLNKCDAHGKEKLTQEEFTKSQFSKTWDLTEMQKEVKGEKENSPMMPR